MFFICYESNLCNSSLACSNSFKLSSVSLREFMIILDKSVMFYLIVLAIKLSIGKKVRLTHVLDLNQVVAIVFVVDAFYTHRQGARFAKVFNRFVYVFGAWEYVRQLHRARIHQQTQQLIVDFEVFRAVLFFNGRGTERA